MDEHPLVLPGIPTRSRWTGLGDSRLCRRQEPMVAYVTSPSFIRHDYIYLFENSIY